MALESLKKLSRSTAVAALGVAMVAAVGSAPASAASLSDYQKFVLSLDFGNGATASGYYYLAKPIQALTPANGFGVPLAEYNVSIKQGPTVVDSFKQSYISNLTGNTSLVNTLQFGGIFQAGIVNPFTGPNVALSFTNTSPFKQLTLQIASTPANPFTGAIAPGTKVLADFVNSTGPSISSPTNGVNAVSVVPEPFTIAGTAVAGVMGLWMKRKQKASSAA